MNTIQATYNASAVPSFCRGNPLSEALPVLPAAADLPVALVKRPLGDFSGVGGDGLSGLYEISSLLDINYPRPESRMFAVRVFSMIHNAYGRMQPLTPGFTRSLNAIDTEQVNANSTRALQCDAMTLIAWSGMGKSTLIRSIAELLPEVIEHTSYQGQKFFQKQVVWLSVDAPINGSPRGFLLAIAQALDNALQLIGPASYYDQMREKSVDAMKGHLARAVRAHCVGLLHVDDVQRWGEADAKTRAISVAMLVGLANTIGCALLLSGTPDALTVLQSNFEASRRANRRSATVLSAPLTATEPFFSGLVDFLFRYQLTSPPVPPSDGFRHLLLDLTAGVPGILTSLYVATQETALTLGEPLSPELFKSVMRDDFGMLQAAAKKLRALRKKGNHHWDRSVDQQMQAYFRKSKPGAGHAP